MLHLPRIDVAKTGHSLGCLSMPAAVLTRPKICSCSSRAASLKHASRLLDHIQGCRKFYAGDIGRTADCDAYVSATD